MASLADSTSNFIADIRTWKITHPKEGVELRFGRKTDGEKYFYCIPPRYTGNRPLLITYKELFRVFTEVNTWADEKFASKSVTNEWGIALLPFVSGFENTERLTLVFSQRNNIDSFEIRMWFRKNAAKIFTTSTLGFSISGEENIITFIKMREEITKRVALVDKLEELFVKAYGIMFNVYNKNCKNHPPDTSPLTIVNVKDFIPHWIEAMKIPRYKDQDLKISAEDMYTYIKAYRFNDLEEYIEKAKHLLSMGNKT